MTEESSGGTQPTRTPPDNNNDDELLSQFLAFSGSSDETKAASYLEMCGNDVETAVSLFLEHEQHQHQHQQHQQQGGLSGGASSLGDSRGGGDIRAPDETRTMRLMDDDDHGNSGGGGGMLYRGGRIPGIGGGDPAAFHLMNAMMDMEEQMSTFAAVPPMLNSRAILDAAIAAQGQGVVLSSQEGKEDYENGATEANNTNVENNEEYEALPPRHHAEPSGLTDMFAPPHHIIHRAGGFQGARTMAKDTKRWLLVNIQRDAEFSSHALNRDVWRDELVENLIREGFIFWQTVRTCL